MVNGSLTPRDNYPKPQYANHLVNQETERTFQVYGRYTMGDGSILPAKAPLVRTANNPDGQQSSTSDR